MSEMIDDGIWKEENTGAYLYEENNIILSGDLPALFSALSKAQSDIEVAEKSAKGHHGKYADIASNIKACKSALSKHGLLLMQPVSVPHPTIVRVTTLLCHSSGGYMSSFVESPVPIGKNQLQALGIAITYLRRYALTSILFMASEDNDGELDDSGNVVHKRNTKQSQPNRTAPPKPKNTQSGGNKPNEATVWFNSLPPEQQTAAKSDGGGIEVALVQHLGMTPKNAASAILEVLDGQPVPITNKTDPNPVQWGKAKKRVELYNKIKAMQDEPTQELEESPDIETWLTKEQYTLSELSKMLVAESVYDDTLIAWQAIKGFDWKQMGEKWGQPKDNSATLTRDQALKFMNLLLS